MLIEREELAQMIPHTGAMCMLAGVHAVDASSIVCVATSHRDPANPLRRRGMLSTVCGVEYAAQAMAVHAAWLHGTNEKPRGGALVSLRETSWTRPRLDDVKEDLTIEARLDAGDARSAAYGFAIKAGALLLLQGRVTVVFAPVLA